MKIRVFIFIVFTVGVANVLAQTSFDERRLATIRDTYKKVNEQIAEMEKDPEHSSVYVTELLVNKNDASYPGVGIYQSTVTFYYTFGDREKNPYPFRLLKAVVATRRAGDREAYEYLFSESGELIFTFEKTEDGERRGYFQGGRSIRVQKGDSVLTNSSVDAKKIATEFLTEAKKLRTVFVNSL